MRAVNILAVIGCWALFAAGAIAQPAQNCGLRIAVGLDLQTLPDGRVTVPAQIDGHDYRFMVDTGGFFNTVSQRVAAREGYSPRLSPSGMVGMGNSYSRFYIRVKDFALGDAHAQDIDFFIDNSGASLDGLLAPQIMARYDLDLDFAHEKLNLISPDHCPGRVVYWTDAPPAIVPMEIVGKTHIRVPVKLDGKDIKALLDTGAHTSFMTLWAASHFLGIDEKTPGLKILGKQTVNGMTRQTYQFPFATLSFGGVTVTNPNILIVSNDVWKSRDMLVGQSIPRQMHMYVAYKEETLYLTPALAGRAQGAPQPAN